ncbi:MAG: hypothetical protein ACREJ0_02995 [Geminicoccaceae bacterium]
MLNIPELMQENKLIDVLVGVLEQNAVTASLSFASITDDWKKSLQDTKDVNTLILESDPAQLRIDLERESELLGAFLAALDGSPDPVSPLAQHLRERWYDLFTRERARNQEIIEAT